MRELNGLILNRLPSATRSSTLVGISVRVLSVAVGYLDESDMSTRHHYIVDATLIRAPNSIHNLCSIRVPEMHHIKKIAAP